MLPHVDLEDRTLVGPGIDIVRLIRLIAEKLHVGDVDSLLGILGTIWNVYSIIAIIVSVIFFIGFVYAKIRYSELSEVEQRQLREAEKKWAEQYGGAPQSQGRWQEIQQHLNDDNPNSWKIAIIEADIFLEQILTDAGYVGVTIGEKLKSANSASFTTIQDAWNAHKVRNEIAHVGDGDFILTRKLAQDTLTQYERVFREFSAI
jgi:hypothetical protein